MSRAERRRAKRNEEKKQATYNLTHEQLNAAIERGVNERLEELKKRATEEAVNTAMTLFLGLPIEVLMDYYWPKTKHKRIPEFTNRVLDYYYMWQKGEISMEQIKDDLWEYGGVRLEEVEL